MSDGTDDNNFLSRLLGPGHEPVSGRRRSLRPKKTASRPGGLPKLKAMFKSPESTQSRTAVPQEPAEKPEYPGVPSQFATEPLMPDTTTPFVNLSSKGVGKKEAATGDEKGDATGSSGARNPERTTIADIPTFEEYTNDKSSGDRDGKNEDTGGPNSPSSPPSPPEPDAVEARPASMWEYSNEARVYHARYADLDHAHDERRFDACREGCLELLMEPRLPLFTRIQTLQMLSTLLKPAAAEVCLQQAERALQSMDGSTFQVQLLREDNENMQVSNYILIQSFYLWRCRPGAAPQDSVGKSLRAVLGAKQFHDI